MLLLIIKQKNTEIPCSICRLVPPVRIELTIDPYHGSVIPLNYGGGMLKDYKQKIFGFTRYIYLFFVPSIN